jgi:hypothetical protein
MKRLVIIAAILGATTLSSGPVSAEDVELPATPAAVNAPPAAPSEITFFDGSSWAPLVRHDIYVKKAKVGGSETYVVVGGMSSEVLVVASRPRFRVASDRAGAFRVRLAQFEREGQNRRTPIEQVRNGTYFTRGIDLEFMEVSDGLWELMPMESLQPGQYALVVSDTEPVADFTVVERDIERSSRFDSPQ